MGRVTRQGALWLASNDGRRWASAVRASSGASVGLCDAGLADLRPDPVDTRLVYVHGPDSPIRVGLTVDVVELVVVALLFATARRANGLAGIHEWASRTRTVLKSPVGARRLVPAVSRGIPVVASQRWIGPYRLVETPQVPPGCGAALGYDERLRRTVWLRFPSIDSDPVPSVRRMLRRPARPRWLAGQRTDGLAWDAYEQVPGQPFETAVTQAQSWELTREWIRDLADEVDAGLRDGSLSALEPDRVWIGDDGHARLLDWSQSEALRDSAGSSADHAGDLPQAQRFLHRVALSALEGHDLPGHQPHDRTRVPLPLPAADCLAKLGDQRFATSEAMVTALRRGLSGPAALSRTKRVVHLSLCAIPTILMLVFGLFSVYQLFVSSFRKDTATRDIAELVACLNQLEVMEGQGVPSTDRQFRALEIYIGGRHRDLISDPPIWSATPFAQRVISSRQRAIADACRGEPPLSSVKADIDDAARMLRSFLDNVRSDLRSAHPYVQSVNDGDVADRAGIKINDVVVMMGDEPIAFASQLGAAIRRYPDQLITLSLLRDGQPLMISATPARRANEGLIGIVIANEGGPKMSPKVAWRYLWLHAIVGLMLAGTLGLLSGLGGRGGIALRLMNIAVVTKNGTLASGWRYGLRAVLSWLPVLAASAAAFAGYAPLFHAYP